MNLQEMTTTLREIAEKVEKLWKGSKHGKAEKQAQDAAKSQDGATQGPVQEEA